MNTEKKELTGRQAEVLAYVRRRRRETGAAPSTREIQRAFGFASQTAVMHHLRALERKGALWRLPGDLRPAVPAEGLREVPILGQIPAGLPAYGEEEQREGCVTVDLASVGIPRNARTFALRVRGDSMTGAHVAEGDVVVLEFREPRSGDIVAALIDGETTLKRFLLRQGRPYLKAENPRYPDLIPARELVVQGVMVALVRTVARR
ncbi:MAG: repressor LexA [Puniceicoccaceae bacterium]|nr:MAG: repressor LexA [Puniceicoccaceae bacterium]